MSAAQHTPEQDQSFRASLIRHGAAAAALVIVVTGAFWAIGSWGDDDATTAASPSTEMEPERDPSDGDGALDLGAGDDEETSDGSEAEPDQVDDEPSDLDDEDGATDEDDPADGEAPDEADDATGDADATEDAEEDDAEADDADDGDDADEGDDAEPAEQAPAIDPATITVQVLDGYQADGGTAAAAVASQLSDAGYDIVAQNPALRYEQTTVLWTAGFEAEARQVAAAIGAAEVRQQPGNLSSQVAVHVVVGSDRG